VARAIDYDRARRQGQNKAHLERRRGSNPRCRKGVKSKRPFPGLNEWADTNNLLVLYPQAIASPANPYGCWDWWGYLSTDYASKSGPQMAAIDAMVQRL
jgi:hypothetical protein